MTDSLISARDLGHAFGKVVALHGVNFEVPPGQIGLVGANGAGKTTLIRILLGILSPTACVSGAPPQPRVVARWLAAIATVEEVSAWGSGWQKVPRRRRNSSCFRV